MFRYYDFQCQKCQNIFEALVKNNQSPECPKCAFPRAKKLPNASGGYSIMGSNGASVRPRQAGAFKSRRRK